MNIRLPEKKIFWSLISTILILSLFSILGQYARYCLGHQNLLGFIDYFHLAEEANFPTLFQTLMIFFAAFLVLIIIKSGPPKNQKHFWITLFVLCIFMGIDESTQIHEKFSYIINKILNHQPGGFLSFSWVIPAIIVAAIAGAYFIAFIVKIKFRFWYLFLIAAIVFLLGSIAIEMVTAYLYNVNGITFIYLLVADIKETIEMIGIALFIRAVLKYIKFKLIKKEVNIELTFL